MAPCCGRAPQSLRGSLRICDLLAQRMVDVDFTWACCARRTNLICPDLQISDDPKRLPVSDIRKRSAVKQASCPSCHQHSPKWQKAWDLGPLLNSIRPLCLCPESLYPVRAPKGPKIDQPAPALAPRLQKRNSRSSHVANETLHLRHQPGRAWD